MSESEVLNTLEEKLWLYKIVKRRIEILRSLEEQGGLPVPETRDNIALALQLLERIRQEMNERRGISVEDLKRQIFGIEGEEYELEG